MAQGLADRLLTIAITATLTSAAWIVAGSLYFDDDEAAGAGAGSEIARDVTEPQQSGMRPAGEPVTRASVMPGTRAGPAPGEAAPLRIPVPGVTPAQLRDSFAEARGGGERRHEALDIMAPAGTPVVAAGPGTIERLFRSGAGGNTVYVRSPDRRTLYYYAHLQDYAPGLEEGETVEAGNRLGSVGSSGNASPEAPHLHFAILRTLPEAEWWEPASAINPYPLFQGTETPPDRRRPVPETMQ